MRTPYMDLGEVSVLGEDVQWLFEMQVKWRESIPCILKRVCAQALNMVTLWVLLLHSNIDYSFFCFLFLYLNFMNGDFFFYYCIVLVETENTFVGLIFTIILSHISFP